MSPRISQWAQLPVEPFQFLVGLGFLQGQRFQFGLGRVAADQFLVFLIRLGLQRFNGRVRAVSLGSEVLIVLQDSGFTLAREFFVQRFLTGNQDQILRDFLEGFPAVSSGSD